MDYLSVTQILSFFTDTRWYTEESRIRGTDVHEFCHLLVTKNILRNKALEIANSDNVKYGSFYKSFIKWHEECDPMPLIAEERLIDTELGLTGKPDFIGVIKGKKGVGLIDFKTSTTIRSQWQFQIAAYVYLATIHNVHIDWGATLSIDKEGKAAKLSYVFILNSIDNKYLKTLQKIFFSLMSLARENIGEKTDEPINRA